MRVRPHLRLDVRRRYRDRLLVAMLAVAIVPLGAFVALVVVDLGAMSRGTVDETHRSILEDSEARQQSQVTDRAKVVDIRLGAIASEVAHLADGMPAQGTPVSGGVAAEAFKPYASAWYAASPDESSTVILTAGSPLVPDIAQHRPAAPVAVAPLALVSYMQQMRHDYPEISGVWVVDQRRGAVQTVPEMDVPAAIASGQLDSSSPVDSTRQRVFSTSEKRLGDAVSAGWADPETPARHAAAGPFWTDPYQTRTAGAGVTVWIPVGDGTVLVGADIAVKDLAEQFLASDIATQPGAYPVLLSSSDRVLTSNPQLQRDFNLREPLVGATLPLSKDDRLAAVERTGHPQPVHLSLGGVDKEMFTAPVYTAKWVLATTVPVAALEPNVNALSRGVASGLHRLLLQAIPVGLVLLLLAFLLARWLAWRLVGPVGALTLAADRLAAGHIDEPVPPQGSDEVGRLARSLEHMRREVNGGRDRILAGARELEQRVATRTIELRRRNEELEALNALAGSLTQSLDERVLLQQGLDTVAAVLPLTAACAYVLGDDGLVAVARQGAVEEHQRLLHTVAAAALDERDTVARSTPEGMLLGLPLETSEGPVGALGLLAREGAPAEAGAGMSLLRSVADQVALAVRTANLSAEGRELAVLEERTRLAREIHDTIAQQLTAIVLQLEAAEAFVGRDEDEAREVIVSARDGARSALQEARRSVWNLRPAPLASTGLVAALGREVERWSERTGIDARFRAEAMGRPLTLRPAAEVALLRIAQEALCNVGQHSGARHVEVDVVADDGAITVTVHDDGSGFDPAAAARVDAFGLVGMEERARLAGATLEVDSRPGGGTRLCVRLPLTDPGQEALSA